MRATFTILHEEARRRALEAVSKAQEGKIVTVGDKTRTLEQNAAQWPYLEAFAEQVPWQVNGEWTYISDEDWKDILTAAFRRETVKAAQAWDGKGIVMLGMRTSEMDTEEFSQWLEFLKSAAALKGVTVYPEDAGPWE